MPGLAVCPQSVFIFFLIFFLSKQRPSKTVSTSMFRTALYLGTLFVRLEEENPVIRDIGLASR